MTVMIGHARHGEGNKITGGRAGDQGGEVAITDYYVHPKGWYVLRCKTARERERIAIAAERACKNSNIGYDQSQRDTLFYAARSKGYDPGRVTAKVETDCSALVRVCIAYAFGKDIAGNIRTVTEASALVRSGKFYKYTSDKYCKQSDYLRRGDILVTKTKGHTVVVLDDGVQVLKIDEPNRFDPKRIGTFRVAAGNGLNARTGAGTDREKICTIPADAEVTCDGYYIEDKSGKPWVKTFFEIDDVPYEAYVSAFYLERAKK